MYSLFTEVNDISLLGENHKDVVSILKELPIKVTMVCCRPVAPPVTQPEILESLSLSEVHLTEKVFFFFKQSLKMTVSLREKKRLSSSTLLEIYFNIFGIGGSLIGNSK